MLDYWRDFSVVGRDLYRGLWLGAPFAAVYFAGAYEGHASPNNTQLAVETGILLAGPFIGLHLAAVFIRMLHAALIPDGVTRPDRPSEVPPNLSRGIVVAAYALVYGLGFMVAGPLMALAGARVAAVIVTMAGLTLVVNVVKWDSSAAGYQRATKHEFPPLCGPRG